MTKKTTASWPPEAEQLCEKLWREGLSHSHIAGRLNALGLARKFTRNAVCGHVFRFKTEIEGRIPPSRPRTAPSLPRGARVAPKIENRAPEPPKGQQQGIKHEDLTPWTCRWPIGDPRSPDFRFCGGQLTERFDGAKGQQPYCNHSFHPSQLHDLQPSKGWKEERRFP